jgi:prophage regulatory protein
MKNIKSEEIAPSRAIRLPQVCSLVGVSRASVWRWSKAEASFPKPFHLSPGVTAWDEREVFAWLDAKKSEQRTNAAT